MINHSESSSVTCVNDIVSDFNSKFNRMKAHAHSDEQIISKYGRWQEDYLIYMICQNFVVPWYVVKWHKQLKITEETYICARIMARQRSNIGC